ncbi:hypothetical protein YC2023_007140 [Brassica napus]
MEPTLLHAVSTQKCFRIFSHFLHAAISPTNPQRDSDRRSDNLRAGRCSNTAEVRLLRFWEAKNINKARELMSVDMLLIDENSTVVHGSIPASRQLRFKNRLSEGSVYTLSGFDVTRSSPKYRLSDAPVSVPFNDETDFEKLPATDRIIPTEHFRFRPYEQIVELANTGD